MVRDSTATGSSKRRLSPEEWLLRVERKKKEAFNIDSDSSVRWKNLAKRMVNNCHNPKFITSSVLDVRHV